MSTENRNLSMEKDLRVPNGQSFAAYLVLRNLNVLLEIPKNIEVRAWNLWLHLEKSHSEEIRDDLESWLACLLYIESVNARLPLDDLSGDTFTSLITVSQLLEATNMSIMVFFDRIKTLKEFGYLNEKVQNAYKTLVVKYLIVCPLFNKFEELFNNIVLTDIINNSCFSGRNFAEQRFGHTLTTLKEICWILFLLAKDQLLTVRSDFLKTIHLLLCCIDYLIKYSPPFFLQSPFDAYHLQVAATKDPLGILKALCEQENASFDDVKDFYFMSWLPFLKHLTEKLGSLEILLLRQCYQDVYMISCDIDETKFLENDPHLSPKRCVVQGSSAESIVAPVRAVLNTVQQLKMLLDQIQDQPSEALQNYFANCSYNPSESIQQRITYLKQKFVENFNLEVNQDISEVAIERFNFGLRLYYRVMEAMLKSEEERLHKNDFNNLLNDSNFHTSLLACSLEVVLIIYDPSWSSNLALARDISSGHLSFPWILTVFELNAFNFLKIIEMFIRSEQKLTKDIIQHLHGIENKILEELAWSSDSPLFEILTDVNTPTSEQSITLDSLLVSNVNGNSLSPNGSYILRRSTLNSLSHFYNKVCRLVYCHLQELSLRLEIEKELMMKIWTCFYEAAFKKTFLLQNRHIDQILLCSIYGVCKVSEIDLKFKTIVSVYQKLPYSKPEVYKRIYISENQYDSIINFYNKIFIPYMSVFIVQFSTTKTSAVPVSPMPKSVQSLLSSSPVYKLPGQNNVYVSPMKYSPFKKPISSSNCRKQSYSFGDFIGSAEKLRSINNIVKGYESPKSLKRHCPFHDDRSDNDYHESAISRNQKQLRFDDVSSGHDIDLQNFHFCDQGVLPAISQFLQHRDKSS